jgi:ArsR family transcriptional regulator, arsenate/arsenite/antimonite-responsive transcriptional repressor
MVSELSARSAAEVVTQFKALGDPTRLRIFEFLCACCCPVAVDDTGGVRPAEGPTAGEVCCSVTGFERITSTVSFHLKELRQAGLITMERQGKNMVCGINRDALAALKAYVNALGVEKTDDCAC